MNRAPFPIVAACGMTALAFSTFGLAACGGPTTPEAQPRREADAASYVAPPAVTAVTGQGEQVLLSGAGAPGATIRLATPQGEAREAQVDAAGHWRLTAPAQPQAALYGLSQSAGGRTLQSEGYLLITQDARALQLRAGAGARSIGPSPAVGVTAFDIDRDGGAVLSGRGLADSAVSARIDGRKLGEGRIDKEGRFSLSLSGPVPPGSHSLKVFGDGLDATLAIDATPAAALTQGPFRATPVAAGLRVDWMTPGGGVQSTLVVRAGEPPRRDLP